MSSAAGGTECERLHDDLALLAFGTLEGLERARVLAHLETCAACRAELEGLSTATDALIGLLPDATAPVDLESRVLAAWRAEVPRRQLRRRLAAAALALALVGGGLGLGIGVGTSGTATLVSPGSIETATLTSPVGLSGEVVLSRGWDARMLMTVEAPANVTQLHCVVTLANGTQHDLGTIFLRAGEGSWGADIGVPLSKVRRVAATDATGRVVASASFAS